MTMGNVKSGAAHGESGFPPPPKASARLAEGRFARSGFLPPSQASARLAEAPFAPEGGSQTNVESGFRRPYVESGSRRPSVQSGFSRTIATLAIALGLATAVIAQGQPPAAGRGAAPAPAPAGGQGRGRGPQAPQTPQASAPIDLTGTWVSIVNEDWRWRMVTPPKGDYASVPLNAEARKVADSWDPSKDGLCDAYGAAGLMRIPTRLNITWENPTTLKIDTDAGQQTRRLLFDVTQKPSGAPTLQGHSIAEWERAGGGRGGGRGAAAQGGSLKVVTTNMRGGWLRKNGVPYSANAVLTEHFDRFAAPTGDEWLVVTSIVSDPTYLTADFITSTHFKKEPNNAKFAPAPCRAG
jgi:hypothetical protein